MSILKYFHPVKQKPDLPDPSGPCIKWNCAADSSSCSERKHRRSPQWSRSYKRKLGPWNSYSFLTAPQKDKVGKREAEHGVTTTIRYYGKVAISPDLARKESIMRRFKNAYRERSKLFHKEVLLRQWEHSKHLYIRGIPHHTWHCKCVHNILPPQVDDDKINNCGFLFSVAHEWRVFIEEDQG